jgi:hypothetical protein
VSPALRAKAAGFAGLLLLLLVWDVVRWSAQPWLVAVLGLPVTVVLPGLLVVACLGARRLTLPTGLFAIGFGVLFLYTVGLVANTLPRLAGVERPLHTPAVWLVFNAGYLGLALLATLRFRGAGTRRPWRPPSRTAAAVCGLAVVVPILAVLGAFTLNNGGDETLAVRALIVAVVVVPVTYLLRHRVGDATLVTVIACVTLALLLATSLRGWYISGQDMQHEFQVFRLAVEQGRWDVSAYADPYNACLSVTLLPVVLSELLRVDGSVVFKLLDQALFVVVPVTLFCVARRFVGRGGAFLLAVLFVGLPTFSIDTPFITRQLLAFVFVALAVAAVFVRSEPWLRLRRRTVLVLLAAGVVTSHYSTAYLFVAGLLALLILSRLQRLLASRRHRGDRVDQDREQIPVAAVLGAVAVAVVWFGPVTHASGDLTQKVTSSSASFARLADNPALLLQTLGRPNGGDDQLTDYVRTTNVGAPGDVPAIVRSLRVVGSDLPDTGATQWLRANTGVDPAALMSGFYYGAGPKLYLLCCLAGTLALFSRRIRTRFGRMPVLYPIWALSAVGVIGLQLLLPDLAGSYGVTRAFMQAFIVLGVPMVVLLRLIFAWSRPVAGAALVTVSTALLVVYSGLGPQATGGLHRQLSLGNAGQYYGSVYPVDTDVAAADWVGRRLPPGAKLNVADFAAVYAYHPTFPYDATDAGLFPFQVRKGDYALLSTSQTRDHLVYTADHLVGLSFDPGLYAGSDLVYSSGSAQIVRRR